MANFTKLTGCLFLIFGLAACTTDSDAFFVVGAAVGEPEMHSVAQREPLQNWEYDIGMEIGLSGHRIVAGEGAAIAFRSQSSVLVIMDSLSYEKFTIFIDKPLAEKKATVRLGADEPALAFWSVGDAMSGELADCIGWASEGVIEYERVSAKEIAFDIWVRIRTVRILSHKNTPCREFIFKQKSLLAEKNVLELTPWEGGPSKSSAYEALR